MAFPQTIETLTLGVDNTTLIDANQWNPPRTLLNKLQSICVGPIWINAIGIGADPTGVADSSAVSIAAIDTVPAGVGAILYYPPGTYRMDTTVKVPSLIGIKGAGMYATKFFAPAASADQPIFEVATTTANTHTNVYSQVYGVSFQDFEIRDRQSSDTLKLQPTGRSEDHHGILIHDSDWSFILNVNFRDLMGYAINFSNVAREWLVMNIYAQNCGDAAELVPAVNIASSSGDATNTIYFYAARVLFSQWIGVVINGTQDGIRLINFTDCQFEGGGNGSAGTFGNPWPYDLVWIQRCSDLVFANCEWSNPGSGKWCVNIQGHSSTYPFRIDFQTPRFNGNGQGGGIRYNLGNTISVSGAWFQGCTAATGDYYVETTAGVIFAALDNMHSANPTAGSPAGHFRGKETATRFNLGDHRLDMPGGGVTSHSAGKPTTNMGLGSAAPNGMAKIYDINNLMWWERIFIAGVGDLWIPEPGQVVGRRVEQIHASNTNENSVYTYTIPAGAVDYWGGICVNVWGDFSGTGVGTATLRVKLGGTTIWADASAALVSGVQGWHVQLYLRANGAVQNAQRLGGFAMINAVAAVTTGQAGDLATDEITGWTVVQASPAADMTIDRVFEVTWQHSAAKVTTVRSGFAQYQG